MVRMDVSQILQQIQNAPLDEQEELLKLLEEHEETTRTNRAQHEFIPFIRQVWPDFVAGSHHKKMADAFERLARGECKRLIINMPPRHTKSEFASVHLPAWVLGQDPRRKIIQATHTSELAVGFGRRVRNLVKSKEFRKVFPGVDLSSDSKAAGRWSTNKNGEYFAVGVGGAVAGKGADLLIVDDPVDEQTAQYGETNPEVYDKIYEWYTLIRQRLQPGAAICIVMTRWSKRDLTAQLLKYAASNDDADQWEVIEFPAILPSGRPLWPEYWELEELEKTRSSIPVHRWNAQYMQDPTSAEGSIIKADWWQKWTKDRPPKVEAVLISWDTAFEKTERANYSACTTWGVFYRETDNGEIPNLILLDAFKDKYEFPDLKRVAFQHFNEWDADMFVVEKKAAGSALIYELRSMGIPVSEFTPTRGNDKIVRANSVADLFSSGAIWAPETHWAEEVIQECHDFPAGENDDYVDSTTQALIRFRQGGLVRLSSDYEEDTDIWKAQRMDRMRRPFY